MHFSDGPGARVQEKKYGDGYVLSHTHMCGPVAGLAMEMVKTWGMVAGIEDGVSPDGKPKLRLMTPDELISRAIETSVKLFDEFERRNWLIAIPEDNDAEDDD